MATKEIHPIYALTAGVVGGAICFATIKKIHDSIKATQLIKENVRLNKIIVNDNLDSIQFIEAFEKLDMKKPIIIEITTYGGSYNEYFHVIKYLAKKKSECTLKIICHIPKYASSGGWLLANCADEFVFRKSSYVTPFDPQFNLAVAEYCPVTMFENKAITDLIDKRGIKEAGVKHKACQIISSSRILIDLLGKMQKWPEDKQNQIFEEFLSGKYEHSTKFMPHELAELGYSVSYF
ncbi:MAG: hypothetical protein Hyperionvirus26_25 [Hyperionvirus sp.]|uniref:Serine dehydrogenase proteinase n=1 Tax=Hyperionvirus sp. TaxID=2487770 RepID=A0A3G5AB82_9VIRU|nr:MAG: hypothetical protein Hyperionvirus26_25 [Hyperionvirus sp.]